MMPRASCSKEGIFAKRSKKPSADGAMPYFSRSALCIRPLDEVQHVVVCDPVDTHDNEAEHKGGDSGQRLLQCCNPDLDTCWKTDIENKECDYNCEDAIAERLKPPLVHRI